MRFKIKLLFLFLIFCRFQCSDDGIETYSKGELTALSGQVLDSNGDIVTTGKVLIAYGSFDPTNEDEILTTQIQADGTYEIAFFNEENIYIGAVIGRIPDENYACHLEFLPLGEELRLDLVIPRHAPKCILKVIHTPNERPDSINTAVNLNRCQEYSIIQSEPELISDSITQYQVLIETDAPNTAFFSITREEEIYEERFDYTYSGNTIIFEMRLD